MLKSGNLFRVLLIAPTALDYSGRPIKQRRLHLPALTLPVLAAVTPSDVEVRLIYETVEAIPLDEHWDLVGITSMGSGIVRAWEIADQFRAMKVKTVIGGIAASLGEPEWTLAHADAIVQGEAEDVWPRVVADAMAGRMASVYRCPEPVSLAGLPVPRYDLMNRRTLGFWRPVQATRGCPFTCNFCSVTSFNEGTYRKRPVSEVVRDVREARRFGSRYIAFVDDNIAVDWDYCRELWEALIPEKIIWMSQASIQIAENPALLELAHRSGCRMLSLGLESIEVDSLQGIEKGWNRPERYLEAIHSIRKNGIDVSTEMIVGLDGDDETIFERTYRFLMQAGITVPRVHILTPIPGTPLYNEMLKQGRLVTTDYANYTGSKAVFRPRQMTDQVLADGHWQLYKRLYRWPAILRRILPNRARLGPYMLAVVWAANIRYRAHIEQHISPGIL
jgi:radical SAM superfamily enzyme YgiQ (UPF0313 family)